MRMRALEFYISDDITNKRQPERIEEVITNPQIAAEPEQALQNAY